MKNFSYYVKRILPSFLGNQGIAKTLLIWILFFSSVITLTLSGLQLFIDYRAEVKTINSRFQEIEYSYKNSIEASLWNVDIEQLDIQAEGIMRLPDIQAVVIKDKQSSGAVVLLSKGESVGHGIQRDYALIHKDGDELIEIGSLYIEATLTEVYKRLLNKAVTIMLVQGIKTFLVSFFILFIFYRLVTRHIIQIEHFLKNIDLRYSFSELILERTPKKDKDELDQLVDAYNMMAHDLRLAYDDIRTVNDKLKEDIAARKKVEAEVKSLNEGLEVRVALRTSELEAANKELNAFCYSVSHDLRAPLRRVDGFRHNLFVECGDRLDQRGIHYLLRMEVCTNEMNSMIDSFLVLSKSTSAELDMKMVSLTRLVDEAVVKLKEKDPDRSVTLKVQRHVRVVCDKALVELLLYNLLDNAWKYTTNAKDPTITFSQKKQDGEVIYCIEDNGAGFSMDFYDTLFVPFTRLHKISDFQGIGIGLATVKRVAARHGGRVWAESAEDQGAKFFFTLRGRG